jgi:hypothetical protein
MAAVNTAGRGFARGGPDPAGSTVAIGAADASHVLDRGSGAVRPARPRGSRVHRAPGRRAMTTLLIVLAAWVVASVPLAITCGTVLAHRAPSFRAPDDRCRLRPSPHHEEIPCPRTAPLSRP